MKICDFSENIRFGQWFLINPGICQHGCWHKAETARRAYLSRPGWFHILMEPLIKSYIRRDQQISYCFICVSSQSQQDFSSVFESQGDIYKLEFYLICSLSNTLFTAESNAHTEASIISFLIPQPHVVVPLLVSMAT